MFIRRKLQHSVEDRNWSGWTEFHEQLPVERVGENSAAAAEIGAPVDHLGHLRAGTLWTCPHVNIWLQLHTFQFIVALFNCGDMSEFPAEIEQNFNNIELYFPDMRTGGIKIVCILYPLMDLYDLEKLRSICDITCAISTYWTIYWWNSHEIVMD